MYLAYLLCLICFAVSGQGLSCFNCMYVTSVSQTPYELETPFDKTCHYGMNPNSTLVESCVKDENYEQISCGTLFVRGKLERNGSSEEIQVTFRTCLGFQRTTPFGCYPFTAKDFSGIDNLPNVLYHAVGKLQPNSPGLLCICSKNKCNKGRDEENYGSSCKRNSICTYNLLLTIFVFFAWKLILFL